MPEYFWQYSVFKVSMISDTSVLENKVGAVGSLGLVPSGYSLSCGSIASKQRHVKPTWHHPSHPLVKQIKLTMQKERRINSLPQNGLVYYPFHRNKQCLVLLVRHYLVPIIP